MGKTVTNRLILFLAFGLFLFLTACSSGSGVPENVPSDAVCSSIIESKCVSCHYKTRICDALGTKSFRKWEKSIKFMVKQGAVLSDDEESKVVACLSALPAGSDVACQ
jgi:hypothetical protein